METFSVQGWLCDRAKEWLRAHAKRRRRPHGKGSHAPAQKRKKLTSTKSSGQP